MTVKTAYTIVIGAFLLVLVFISGLYLGRKQQAISAPSARTPLAISGTSVQALSVAPSLVPRAPIVPTPQTSPTDDVRQAVIQATPEIAASGNGGTVYNVVRLKPKVEVSLTSATEAKCRLIMYVAPTATLTATYSVSLTKYDTEWKVDNYKLIAVGDQAV